MLSALETTVLVEFVASPSSVNMIALFYKLKDSNYGRFLLVLLCLIAVMPFVTHYYLTKRSGINHFTPSRFIQDQLYKTMKTLTTD